MVTFAHTVALGDDDTLGAFHRTAHVWLQFGAFHLAVAVDGIDFPVVVEEYAKVVDVTLHVVVLPWTANVFGCVTLQTFAVDI